jgi:hypothetical protein
MVAAGTEVAWVGEEEEEREPVTLVERGTRTAYEQLFWRCLDMMTYAQARADSNEPLSELEARDWECISNIVRQTANVVTKMRDRLPQPEEEEE